VHQVPETDAGPATPQATEQATGLNAPRPGWRTAFRHHRGAGLALAALLTGLLAGGCSSSPAGPKARPQPSAPATTAARTHAPPQPSGTTAACTKLPAADIPGAVGTVTEADSGTFCLPLGQRVDVFLTVPGGPGSKGPRWSPAASSDRTVLAPRTSGILTAPLGVTPGVFQSLRPGTVTLTSRLAPGRAWKVTIVVQAT
jgi:hypothetical protein